MKCVIACGGTGGHFYPGYALGKILRSRGHEVLFALRRDDPAAPRLEAEGLPFVELDLRGMPRGLSAAWLTFPWKAASSLRVARNVLRSYRAHAAVGMGGYLTFPVAFAARWLRIPYVLHESNSILGLANRVCARGAHTLALGLPLRGGGGGRAILTGTPVREDLRTCADGPAARKRLGLDPDRLTVLVFGGSQGAQALNRAVPPVLKALARELPEKLQVVHLTGHNDETTVLERYSGGESDLKWTVIPYAQEMGTVYAAADLVLARAGASTVSELIAQRKPAVLVPYPHAAGDHQTVNARVLEDAGAADVLPEELLTPDTLAEGLKSVLSDRERLAEMAAAYGRLRLPPPGDSGDALADLVEQAVL